MKTANTMLGISSGLISLITIIMLLVYKTPITDEITGKIVMSWSIGAYLSILVLFAIFFKHRLLINAINSLALLSYFCFVSTLLRNYQFLKFGNDSINIAIYSLGVIVIAIKAIEIFLSLLMIKKKNQKAA
ncbi:MAG: hypothetical protein ACOYMB_03480 [Patescibacteria group bacterium]